MEFTTHDSPIGPLLLVGDTTGIRHIIFPSGKGHRKPDKNWQANPAGFDDLRRQLDDYFAGSLQQFTIPVAPSGTGFQLQVWQQLQKLEYGQTCSYGQLAKNIGNPAACRAVGAANGANPIPIIIPCHRVIGATGKLTGFGGGIATKQWLLAHERGEQSLFSF